jgi:hypothetical protein
MGAGIMWSLGGGSRFLAVRFSVQELTAGSESQLHALGLCVSDANDYAFTERTRRASDRIERDRDIPRVEQTIQL